MKNFWKKTLKSFKKLGKKRCKGTSSIELVFFVMACCLLVVFSTEIYSVIKLFKDKSSIILQKYRKQAEEELIKLDGEIAEYQNKK